MSELEELRAEVRRLADREAIQDVMIGFAAAMDGRDWDLLSRLFAPDAVFDHGHDSFDGPVKDDWVGRDVIYEKVTTGVSHHAASHHVVSNHRIKLDGDRARVVTYLSSIHLDDPNAPNVHAGHGAWYLAELVRQPEGWQIRFLKHTSLWTAGDYTVLGPVTRARVDEMRGWLD
jgi:hypothetical protein